MNKLDLPTLRDVMCKSCSAGLGIRCTYSGWRGGHPARRELLARRIDRFRARGVKAGDADFPESTDDLMVWDHVAELAVAA